MTQSQIAVNVPKIELNQTRHPTKENKRMDKNTLGASGKICSFCDALEQDMAMIIQAHEKDVVICDQCVELCNDILESRGILQVRNCQHSNNTRLS